MSFHKFNLDWDDYIELDRDELVNDKDKLKVVVTPRLVSPAPSSYKSLDDLYSEELVTTPSSKSPDELTMDSSHSTECNVSAIVFPLCSKRGLSAVTFSEVA